MDDLLCLVNDSTAVSAAAIKANFATTPTGSYTDGNLSDLGNEQVGVESGKLKVENGFPEAILAPSPWERAGVRLWRGVGGEASKSKKGISLRDAF
ncbi:hypothetical protein EZS27_022475 [termite gut metagenome]|uniref:Uncharacterized protein n=1 Tax=termite gut metagenome TaxID=433724 RepID=A0A5J4R6C1_9ZZZZ